MDGLNMDGPRSENTYIMGPEGYGPGAKFERDKVGPSIAIMKIYHHTTTIKL